MRDLCAAIVFVFLFVCGSALATEDEKAAYLMAYFTNASERLRYAVSTDAKNWDPLTKEPLAGWEERFVRDPYIRKVNGVFHLVHTTGFRGHTIAHWQSRDLLNWTGGAIQVMPEVAGKRQRCWAPEFIWSEEEQVFYVHWSSFQPDQSQRMTIYYLKTRDFKDINPEASAVYYDNGRHVIDLTIEKFQGTYYGFHEVGQWKAPMLGNLMVTSQSLDPAIDNQKGSWTGRVAEPAAPHGSGSRT